MRNTPAGWLPSLGAAEQPCHVNRRAGRPQRLVILFSPNGTVPSAFWPATAGREFELPGILQPLEEFRDRMLVLRGIDNRVRGDGDDHMRGMSCLLTGVELAPGNIQGGSNTPAGWPRGPSIDQVLGGRLQSVPETETRFGTLEFGVLVPERADVWTRMVYAGANRPVTPVSDPRQMFRRMFGGVEDPQGLSSVLDSIAVDLQRLAPRLSREDRHLLEQHLTSVREQEAALTRPPDADGPPVPPEGLAIEQKASRMPEISGAQRGLLVTAFRSDLARIATLQFTNAVGDAKMTFLGIEEGHHELSHEPDEKADVVEKLVRINRWYCEQMAELARQLAQTPEPDGEGSLLDHTTVIWCNELGKGNSHTLSDIPFVLVGGGLGWKAGESLQFRHVAHNRLWLSLAQAMGHPLGSFGNPRLSRGGVMEELFA